MTEKAMDAKADDLLRQDYEAGIAEAAERLRATISLVQSGLQNLTLINGGALIALFSLVGAVSGKSGVRLDGSMLWLSFACYAGGLTFTVLSLFGAFFSQDNFALVSTYQAWNAQAELAGKEKRYSFDVATRRGRVAQYAGIAAAVLALVAFMFGCGFALAGVTPAT